MKKKRKLLVIVGPTASGKSALAVELARRFKGEVISADSRQVYRGLNIGTGKITHRKMRGVPHHLLDVASPKRTFTAHDFVELASMEIESISRRGKLPIVVGGTGFYVDVLVGRIALPDVPANRKLRTKFEKKSARELFVLLKKKDPRRARTIEPHNKRRLIRALEIISALGRVPVPKNSSAYDVLWLGISLPLRELEKKIAVRLHARMKQGMTAEARHLRKAGLSYKRMEELGLEYRALARHLKGQISRAQMIDELSRDIRRFAKRQITYWKRNRSIVWFTSPRKQNVERYVRNAMSTVRRG